MNPEKCPHCGAPEINMPGVLEYKCGSYTTELHEEVDPDRLRRTTQCMQVGYERQIAALRAELDKRKWQPIETAPLDMPLQLGWWELWPEKK